MGGTHPAQTSLEEWTESEWQTLPQNHSKIHTNTLRNIRTGALADEYQLSWNSQSQYLFYLKSLNWRHRKVNCSPVVASVGMRMLGNGGLCTGRWTANVYLQHVEVRLSQIDQIPLSDSLYILLTALQGFQQLYLHAGYFRVEEQQICIDSSGRVKVWVNGSLQKNYPEVDQETECLRRDETHMVRQLIDIIESNTDSDDFRQMPLLSVYMSELRKRQRCEVGFQRAENAILKYASQYGIFVPNRMESAVELFQKDRQQARNMNNPEISFIQEMRVPQMFVHQNNQNNQNHYRSMPNLMQTQNVYHQDQHFSEMMNQKQTQPYIYQQSYPQQNAEKVPQGYRPILQQQLFKPVQTYFSPPPQLNNQELREMGPSSPKSMPIKQSRPTTNTKSMVVGFEEGTQSQSLHLQDENSTVKGGSQRDINSINQSRAKNWLRYSQNIQQNFAQIHHFSSMKFNRDTFGLPAHRRFMKESTSSYHMPSSNSSKRNSSKRNSSKRTPYSRSYRASSQKESSFSEVIYEASRERYFVGLGQEVEIDPDIAADIIKYLG